MTNLRNITLNHILLTVIAVTLIVMCFRIDTRLHEIDQDVDNISDFCQKISQSLEVR